MRGLDCGVGSRTSGLQPWSLPGTVGRARVVPDDTSIGLVDEEVDPHIVVSVDARDPWNEFSDPNCTMRSG